MLYLCPSGQALQTSVPGTRTTMREHTGWQPGLRWLHRPCHQLLWRSHECCARRSQLVALGLGLPTGMGRVPAQ